jgi:hypothetical protein
LNDGESLNHDFVYKTTDQFSPHEREQFLGLFTSVFPRAISPAEFERKYLCTPLGYSHHGLMFVDSRLAGAYNLVPYRYRCFGEPRLFGLSVDTMVAPEHRGGPFNLLRMARMTYEGAAQDRIGFVFGFPNDNAHRFTTRVLQWKDMGELDYYALPVNIGAFQRRLWWANPVTRFGAACIVHWPRLNREVCPDFGVEKVQDGQFERHRYDGEHQRIDLPGGMCTCRTCLELKRVRTTYIIDVVPLTRGNVAHAVKAVYDTVRGRTDLLLYVGRLPFCSAGLLRIPASKRPRRIFMCGRVLDDRLASEHVLDIENWNVNISNFDVR